MASSAAARSQQATIAALTRSAKEPSGAKMTEKARRAFEQKWYDQTDPSLPASERRRQADAAYRAHMRTIARRPHVIASETVVCAPAIAEIKAAAEEAVSRIYAAATQGIHDALADAADAKLRAEPV
jgi:ribosomal protein S20